MARKTEEVVETDGTALSTERLLALDPEVTVGERKATRRVTDEDPDPETEEDPDLRAESMRERDPEADPCRRTERQGSSPYLGAENPDETTPGPDHSLGVRSEAGDSSEMHNWLLVDANVDTN